MLKIFYSNRIEQLYLDFKQNLYSKDFPFARRLIIVPTAAIKSWLLLKLAEDPTMGIAMGLEVLDLDEAYKKISQLLIPETNLPYYPSVLELTLAIEAHIRKIADSWSELPSPQKEQWEPLMNYLKIKLSKYSHTLNLRSEKRITTLSQTLAKIFYDYGKYGHAMLESWQPEHGWQQALWMHLFSTWNKGWSYPAKEYTSLKIKDESFTNIFLHLFRAIAASLAMYLFFRSLSNIPLVTANVLNLTHPLFSILIAAFILKENTNLLEMIFCMLGFIGVIFILQPSMESTFNFYALCALFSGFFTSLSIVGVRKLARKEHPYSILLYNSLLSLSITGIFLLLAGIPKQIPDLYPLLLVGLFGSLYQDLLIRALALSPAKIPSSMMYLSIASSYFIGFTGQNKSINIAAMIGIIMIASSGIMLILKNKS